MSDSRYTVANRLRVLAQEGRTPSGMAAKLAEMADELDATMPESQTSLSSTGSLPFMFMANAAKDAMTFVNRDYVYETVNRAFLELVSPDIDDPLGMRVPDIWGESIFEESIRPKMDRAFEGHEVSCEFWYEPPGVERKFFEANYHPCRDETGAVSHVVVVTRNMTAWRQATEAARTSEKQYRNLVESINETIYTLDTDGIITYVSATLERITGVPKESFEGKSFDVFVHPDDLQHVKESFQNVLAGGPSGAEFRIQSKSGGYVWVRSSASRTLDGGTPVGLTGTLSNITEAKEANLALRRSERKYRDIFHNIQDAYFEMDLDGMLLEVSPSIMRMNGLPRDALLGRNAIDFFDDPHSFNQGMEQLKTHGEVAELELNMLGIDRLPLQCLISAAMVKDHERDVYKVVGSIHNISELKRVEADLQQAKAFLEQVVNTVPDPIYVKGEDHRWRMVNDAFGELLGLPKEKLYGKSVSDFFPPDQALSFKTMDKQVFDQGGMVTHEEEFWDTSGVWHVISTNKALFEADGDSERLLVGVLRDITEQKRLEEMLWRAKEEAESLAVTKSRFLANMSHEIRTPLNGVIGMLQLMLSGSLDHQMAEYANTAMSSARGLLTVINDVLDLSKIEAGKMEVVNSRFEVRSVVASVLKALEGTKRDSSIQLSTHVDEAVPELLFGGAARIRQVLFNLVGNALKFTREGSVSIEVSWLPADKDNRRRLLFCVSDTGVGIPDESLELIFDDFAQVDDSFTREYQGAGLGLSIARRLVEFMGGVVSIISEEGVGTSISFTVLAEAAEDEKDGALGQDVDVTLPLPYSKALVVEDNAVNQLLARRFLEKFGIPAFGAANGQQAIEELERCAGTSEAYDLVLMDIQMPVMDGLEATRRIRASTATGVARIPVVALTAHAMEGDRERFMDCGMDGYAAKPMVLEDLRSVLAGLAQKAH